MSTFSTNVNIDGTLRPNMLNLGNFPAGGSIGSAATTVDLNAIIDIAQTTANQVLTVPQPTDLTAGRILFLHNGGTTPFVITNTTGNGMNVNIPPGNGILVHFDGAAWSLHAFPQVNRIEVIRVNSGSATVTTASGAFSTLKSSGTILFSGRPVLFLVSVDMLDNNAGVNEFYRAEFAIQIDAGADNVVAQNNGNFDNNHQGSMGMVILTPTAGTHTINLRWRRVNGAGTMTFTSNSYAIVHGLEA